MDTSFERIPALFTQVLPSGCLQCRRPRVRSLGWEDPLDVGMTTPVFLPVDSSWTEVPGGLQSMGLQLLYEKQP